MCENVVTSSRRAARSGIGHMQVENVDLANGPYHQFPLPALLPYLDVKAIKQLRLVSKGFCKEIDNHLSCLKPKRLKVRIMFTIVSLWKFAFHTLKKVLVHEWQPYRFQTMMGQSNRRKKTILYSYTIDMRRLHLKKADLPLSFVLLADFKSCFADKPWMRQCLHMSSKLL